METVTESDEGRQGDKDGDGDEESSEVSERSKMT